MTDAAKEEKNAEVVALYYEPDPNAPWYHKYNPCHYDHLYSLDWIQRVAEAFAPACQCCAGVRIAILLIGLVLGQYVPFLSSICTIAVVCAIIVDNVRQIFQARKRDDSGNA